jgi:hypothetical protein
MYLAAHNMPAIALIITDLLKALFWFYGAFCAATHGHKAVMILR